MQIIFSSRARQFSGLSAASLSAMAGPLNNASSEMPSGVSLGKNIAHFSQAQWPSNPGEDHHAAKLKEADVLEIYQLYRDGMRTANITARKGVTVGMIQNIVAGRSWQHMHERHGGPMPAERRQRNRLVGKAPIKLVQCLPTFWDFAATLSILALDNLAGSVREERAVLLLSPVRSKPSSRIPTSILSRARRPMIGPEGSLLRRAIIDEGTIADHCWRRALEAFAMNERLQADTYRQILSKRWISRWCFWRARTTRGVLPDNAHHAVSSREDVPERGVCIDAEIKSARSFNSTYGPIDLA